MVDKSIFWWEATGALVIIILGTVLHFIYGWSGDWKPIGLIAPVNESVWEHLKLVLWPALGFALLEFRHIGYTANNFWTAKTAGIYAAMAFIVIIFYIYTFFTGKSILVVDILIFIIGVIAGQVISLGILNLKSLPTWVNRLSLSLLSLLICVVLIFTFYPPHLPVFKNPVDGKYGASS